MMEYVQILGNEIYKILFLLVPILVSVAMIVWLDRRVWGLVQKRKGPNVVGPFGLFQTLADALKYIFKEIIEYKTNLAFQDFVSQQFYSPLGLNTMGFLPKTRFDKSRIVPTEFDYYFRSQLLQGDVHDMGAAMLGGVSGHAGLFFKCQ